ncbi:MAG TPA: hypothetical protein EYQ27_00075, partial [Gemmatimonadetes bacterium]|nr:hypothetical protein [Gemmatimonadota bacterium]
MPSRLAPAGLRLEGDAVEADFEEVGGHEVGDVDLQVHATDALVLGIVGDRERDLVRLLWVCLDGDGQLGVVDEAVRILSTLTQEVVLV